MTRMWPHATAADPGPDLLPARSITVKTDSFIKPRLLRDRHPGHTTLEARRRYPATNEGVGRSHLQAALRTAPEIRIGNTLSTTPAPTFRLEACCNRLLFMNFRVAENPAQVWGFGLLQPFDR